MGGRIETVEMGGHPIDLGAAYIHGCDAMYNTVFRLASHLGVNVDQTAGGYSRGWGVEAPWFDSATGRQLNPAQVRRAYAAIISAKALMDATPLQKLREWEQRHAEIWERRRRPSGSNNGSSPPPSTSW